MYDIRPGKGAGLFLQPWSPHGGDYTRIINGRLRCILYALHDDTCTGTCVWTVTICSDSQSLRTRQRKGLEANERDDLSIDSPTLNHYIASNSMSKCCAWCRSQIGTGRPLRQRNPHSSIPRHCDLELWPSGPEVRATPECLEVIVCTGVAWPSAAQSWR